MSGALNLPTSWKIRKTLWNTFLGLKYKGAKPANISVPVPGQPKIRPVPLSTVYPTLPIDNVLVADHIPSDEAQPTKRKAVSFQVWISQRFPQMQPGLPPVVDDPGERLVYAYAGGRSKLFPSPVIPEALKIEDKAAMLGRLAVEGPFACYVEKCEGGFHWDLLYLNRPEFTLHPELEPIGSRVLFKVDKKSKSLRATQIETSTGTFSDGDEGWDDAVKLALCAVSNDISIVRHFNWVHMIGGSMFAIATRNRLNADHPMRRMLWPHMFRTQYSNDMITEVQLGPTGDFANMFSFDADGVHRLVSATYDKFRVDSVHPHLDARRRGIARAGFETPSQKNLERLYDVFLKHTSRTIGTYYPDEESFAADAEMTGWLEEMDQLLPGGIGAITDGKPGRQGAAELMAAMIYLGSVQHEILGTNLWNYQLWTHIIPCRVDFERKHEPVDVYQRLLNANLNLNIYRAQIMRDFSYLAIDDRGRALFRQFLADLTALNDEMRSEPHEPWRIYPDILEANMNA